MKQRQLLIECASFFAGESNRFTPNAFNAISDALYEIAEEQDLARVDRALLLLNNVAKLIEIRKAAA